MSLGSFSRRSGSGSEHLVIIVVTGGLFLAKEASLDNVFGVSCVRSIITTSFSWLVWIKVR